MQIKKSIQLTSGALQQLIDSGESYDFRLDQEAWQGLKTGDLIEFWEDFTGWQTKPTEKARKVTTEILQVYKAKSFPELFELIEKESAKLKDKEELLSGLRSWWSADKEAQEGVLAFHVKVVD